MKKTILIVDDKKEILESLSSVLESADYHVVTADSRTAGIACYDKHPVDLIVTDCTMHACGNGFDLISDVRKRGGMEPIIMFSSEYGIKQKMAAMTGDNAFVIKPSRPGELLQKISGMLERHAQGQWLGK